MTGMGSDQEILLQKVCPTNSSPLSSSCRQPPALSSSSVPISSSRIPAVAPVKVTNAQVRIMGDNNAASRSSRDVIDNSVCHSDSTEFEMPFGIDDDDLVNYQPPVIYSSRSSSAKYFNRTSSKSFDLETFEEDLNLNHNGIDDSIFSVARSVISNCPIKPLCQFFYSPHFLSSNRFKKWCENLCSPIALCISRTSDQENRINTVIWRSGCCTGLCSRYDQMLRKDNGSSQLAGESSRTMRECSTAAADSSILRQSSAIAPAAAVAAAAAAAAPSHVLRQRTDSHTDAVTVFTDSLHLLSDQVSLHIELRLIPQPTMHANNRLLG